MQFYNSFQIQELYNGMSFLHVFSASLDENEMIAEQYLFSRSAVCYTAQVALTFELVCKIPNCSHSMKATENYFIWIY